MTKNYLEKYEFETGSDLTGNEKIAFEEEKALNILRQRRINLLPPFDLWEKAVLRGREEDSPEVMTWYANILSLVETAFDNIPEEISKYM